MPPRKKRESNETLKNKQQNDTKRMKSTSVKVQRQSSQKVSNLEIGDASAPKKKTLRRKKTALHKNNGSKVDRDDFLTISNSDISRQQISAVNSATLATNSKMIKGPPKRKVPLDASELNQPLASRTKSITADQKKRIKSEYEVKELQTRPKRKSPKIGLETSIKSENGQHYSSEKKAVTANKRKSIKSECDHTRQSVLKKNETKPVEQRKNIKPENNHPIKKPKVLVKRERDLVDDISLCNSMINEVFSKETSTLGLTVERKDFCTINDNTSSSESEWEDVEDQTEQDLDEYKPQIPKEGVEITIDCPELNIRKRKKKEFDEMDYIRLYINRTRKEVQLNIHKMHLLCLLAHGLYVNKLLNSPDLKAMALSYIPVDLLMETSSKQIDKVHCNGLDGIARWFRSVFSFEKERIAFLNIAVNLPLYFESRKALNASEYNLMFIVVARTLGFKTRFCISFYPVSYKAQNLIKKPTTTKKESEQTADSSKCKGVASNVAGPSKTKETSKQKPNKKTIKAKTRQVKVKDEKAKNQKSCPGRSPIKSYKLSSGESGDENDEDEYVVSEEECKSRRSLPKIPKKKTNRSVLSSDSASSSPELVAFVAENIICWAEVFLKAENRWISVDCVNNFVNKPYTIEGKLLQPVTYILAFDNNSYIKDLTKRYCSNYMTSTVKLRADDDWWEETLSPFLPPNSKLDKEEEKDLEEMLTKKPLPNTVSGFKNHPLYALKRHLLKFEAIYPPDATPVGFLKKEAVYARQNVCQLHSRETWLKEARVVRIGEEPYKIVKARPKWDKLAGVLRTDLPLNVFGFWQTEPYEPPIAVDGKVPRNEYGNVELFKPCMLPKGTVHLQMPGLNRIAKKLGIDCSPAVVGFDGHKGSVHPVFDGFIVCEEFQDTMRAAWQEEQENARKREEEKREKRIYGNWRRLIRHLLIREKIKLKYNVE